MIDDFAKERLHGTLRRNREVLVWKLDGLAEYDVRRPLTVTGTNLLGLVKHAATWEARYFGEVFGRPYPGPGVPPWQESDGGDLWVTADESREAILEFARRVWEHADATIDALPIDATGRVPWWSSPEVNLFSIMVHMIDDIARHAGHADILREQLDGRTGFMAEYEEPHDAAARLARYAQIEEAAEADAARTSTGTATV
jgi:hypothetical protein